MGKRQSATVTVVATRTFSVVLATSIGNQREIITISDADQMEMATILQTVKDQTLVHTLNWVMKPGLKVTAVNVVDNDNNNAYLGSFNVKKTQDSIWLTPIGETAWGKSPIGSPLPEKQSSEAEREVEALLSDATVEPQVEATVPPVTATVISTVAAKDYAPIKGQIITFHPDYVMNGTALGECMVTLVESDKFTFESDNYEAQLTLPIGNHSPVVIVRQEKVGGIVLTDEDAAGIKKDLDLFREILAALAVGDTAGAYKLIGLVPPAVPVTVVPQPVAIQPVVAIPAVVPVPVVDQLEEKLNALKTLMMKNALALNNPENLTDEQRKALYEELSKASTAYTSLLAEVTKTQGQGKANELRAKADKAARSTLGILGDSVAAVGTAVRGGNEALRQVTGTLVDLGHGVLVSTLNTGIDIANAGQKLIHAVRNPAHDLIDGLGKAMQKLGSN